jgi:crotonobetainyl-CoA:carnitine CoA-transferase CaiB-like acyl-CoA transferase
MRDEPGEDPVRPPSEEPSSFLAGIRVIETANELGEYCGKLLAGLGADVVKIEPPGGELTRTYGPFYGEADPNRSLHFWHYNLGKRSVVLDLDTEPGQRQFRELAKDADVVLDTRPFRYMSDRKIGYTDLTSENPGIVYGRITPFGDEGPWASYNSSDLVHLALGGVMMNCGYDPEPGGFYDTPPIAPQMWQSYQIAGELMGMAIVSALIHRCDAGVGQYLETSVHEAVSKNTETDLPNWVYLAQAHSRRTCRHSMPISSEPALGLTKDGRWLLPYRTYLPGTLDGWQGTVRLLAKYEVEQDLADPRYDNEELRHSPATTTRLSALTDRLIGSFQFSHDLWREAQAEGLPWAPVRRPEENLADEHWTKRETFFEVFHPELDETFTYVGAKWVAPGIPWRRGPRPPLIGEHDAEILQPIQAAISNPGDSQRVVAFRRSSPGRPSKLSPRGKPFALSGVRIVDLTWLLASAGAGRFFTALGAEVIKVEHESKWDGMRWGAGSAPAGGRAERDRAGGPLVTPPRSTPNRSGAFMEINAGKLAVSLNLKEEEGKQLLRRLIQDADMVIEGFSPGTMQRMGFGYDALREINPRIIYVQQSGMGQIGTYGQVRSFGPTAQALSGLSEMSGLPEPFAPAGIGYSYLDWFGAYNMATAMMAALFRQRTTGKGCYIDSSQVETGIYLTGTAVLNFSANGEPFKRYGNRSPYKLAAPHGAFRVAGTDRWLAISCFTEEQWRGFTAVLGNPDWSDQGRFETLEQRIAHQDELEALVHTSTAPWEPYELMEALQQVGVPAGVCQTAQDRYERDPQLQDVEWLVELEQTEIGRWPVKELPVKYSQTPPYIGGAVNRSGPNYGEDNHFVYGEILGLTQEAIKELEQRGII